MSAFHQGNLKLTGLLCQLCTCNNGLKNWPDQDFIEAPPRDDDVIGITVLILINPRRKNNPKNVDTRNVFTLGTMQSK